METITSADLQELVSRIESELPEDIETRNEYSGRYMYGSSCIGFVVENSIMFLMALTAFLIEMDAEGFYVPDWRNLTVRTDNMARSTIVYFPNWEIKEDE